MKHPILIKFGDNDFINTFMPLLQALCDTNFDGTKQEAIELVNASTMTFYCIYQNKGKVPREITESEYNVSRYLRVTEKEVYYGAEEVDGFFQNDEMMGRCDSDCFYVYPHMTAPEMI